MTSAMRRAAGELQAPLGIVLEGGYALSALAGSVCATLAAMQDGDGAPVSGRVPEAVAARERLTRWWPALGG
jgi:acetoin utilization deacetylase AcuC-like enzyme